MFQPSTCHSRIPADAGKDAQLYHEAQVQTDGMTSHRPKHSCQTAPFCCLPTKVTALV